MPSEWKWIKNLFLLSMALLLSVIPYIEASANQYIPDAGDASVSAVALSSRVSVSLNGWMPNRGIEALKWKEASATTPQATFSDTSKPNREKPSIKPPAPESAPSRQVIKMAAPAAPYEKYVTTAYYLNVREEASSESPILRVVEMGELLNVMKQTANGWLQLYDGGFVHSAYAQPVADWSGSVTMTLAPPANEQERPETADLSRTLEPAKPSRSTQQVSAEQPAKPTSVVHSDSGLTTEHIDQILKGTALEDQSLVSAILEIEDEYGINAYFTIAVMKLESGNGKSRLAKSKNNLFGLNATGGSNAKAYAFDSKADCVRKFGQLISDYYVDKGYTTVEKVAGKYCPANDDWSKLVKKIMYSDHNKLADSQVS